MKHAPEALVVDATPPAEGGDSTQKSGPALVVAASALRARLFRAANPAAPLEELDALVNPEVRLHEHDLVEDSAGRRGRRPTQAKRSRFGGQTARRHRAEDFAAAVCRHATRSLRAARARRLYLVAEPEFLGLLRRRLKPAVRRHVAGEVAKSVSGQPAARIRSTLPARL